MTALLNIDAYLLALLLQLGIAVLAVLLACLVLRIPFATALLGVALCNALPLPSIFAFNTPIFLHDLLIPVLIVFLLVRRGRPIPWVYWFGVAAVFLWPLIGTCLLAATGAQENEWIVFIVRRFNFIILFLAGIRGIFPELKARDLLDVVTLIWIGMAIVGLLQAAGLVNVDVLGMNLDDEMTNLSMRGFLGLNRGAVGTWGAMVAAYAGAALLASPTLHTLQRWLYYTAICLTLLVIFFTGSRTGLVAVALSLCYILARALLAPGLRARIGRVMPLVMAFVILVLIVSSFTNIVNRFMPSEWTLDESGADRVSVQQETLQYVLSDPRALMVGMGTSTSQFVTLVGQRDTNLTHPHSEYFETLWESGLPGLILYLAFIGILFSRMRLIRGAPTLTIALAGQGILVAGLVTGVAVGNIMITSFRLAPFSLLMAFVYGNLVREMAVQRQRASAPAPSASPRPVSVNGSMT